MTTDPEFSKANASSGSLERETLVRRQDLPPPPTDTEGTGQRLTPSGVRTATRCSIDQRTLDAAEGPVELTAGVLHALSAAQQRSVRSIQNALKREHTSIVKAMGQVLLHAKKAGEYLDRLTQIAPKGFTAKVRDEVCTSLGISERTGYLYLRIFKHWEEIEKATDVAGLAMESLSLRRALSLIPKKPRAADTDRTLSTETSVCETLPDEDINPGLIHPLGADGAPQRDIIDRAIEFVNGEFTLCVTPDRCHRVVPAHCCVTLPEALNIPWTGYVWLDTATSSDPEPWLAKLQSHLAHSEPQVQEAIMLLALPNDVLVWERITELAHVIVLLAPAPSHTELASYSPWSVLAYVGPRRKSFAVAFSELGTAMVPIRPA